MNTYQHLCRVAALGAALVVAGCDSGGEEEHLEPGPFDFRMNLTGLSPHIGRIFGLRVVEQGNAANVVHTEIKESLDVESLTIARQDILVKGKAYNVEFFADHNGNGAYDAPPADHAWREAIAAVGHDVTINWSHNVDFKDIGGFDLNIDPGPFDFTMNFSGMSPHVGVLVAMRVVEHGTTTIVYSDLARELEDEQFTITAPDVLAKGKAYDVEFFADHNDNGEYDAPPADHAWREAIAAVTGDVTINWSHNVDFTDIGDFDIPPAVFAPPPGHTELSFSIDDRNNMTYEQGELRWKGSFEVLDEAARTLKHAPDWSGGDGPYPTLYDDGPWNAGGHEMAGATAGDHIWSVSVWFANPEAETMFEYGAENNNGGWVWIGSNGTFTVAAGGSATPIVATGLTIPAFGEIDFKLTLDVSMLGGGHTFDPLTDTLTVKGSAWAWAEIDMKDDQIDGDDVAGDGIYTFVLGSHAGRGALKHSGLLRAGDAPEFVIVVHGVEYKMAGAALADGVKAFIKQPGGAFTEVTITLAGNNNTKIDVPGGT